MGIEPTLSAWEADVLPLNHTRAPLVNGSIVAEKFNKCKRNFWGVRADSGPTFALDNELSVDYD